MTQNTLISVIIPFFNGEKYIDNCIRSLFAQKEKEKLEIIMINDGSTDYGPNKIKNIKNLNIKLLNLAKNQGPSTARNLGINEAKSEYVYFYDIDDELEIDTFSTLIHSLEEKRYDLIFSDKKRVLKSINLRNGKFQYSHDINLDNSSIIELMKKRFFNPNETHKIFDLTGKLIKRKILIDNRVKFEEKLRYLEDECFLWNVLSFVNNAKYVRKQLYIYNIRPNQSSGISEGLRNKFELSNFKIVKDQIKICLEKKKISEKKIKEILDQGLIYIVISALVSLTRSIIQKKINEENSIKYLRELINLITRDKEIVETAKNYTPYKDESKWIPISIRLQSRWLLEFFCKLRVKQIIKNRKS